MLWYGLVMAWHGMVWYGRVWYGMVWSGYGIVSCGIISMDSPFHHQFSNMCDSMRTLTDPCTLR
eukprot:NODE_5225_length_292_cov_43.288066_g5142_i0.p2 GENE.NODE_5225_length_292_cov_43.288066_g5142_i0~~NODE_5225_length_292_cov_43.288066_g5142_i0.p2  ORF type:complete len:64 (+),score=18.44 NODE_5225_length_292_cov_43.288066_g5142_i0:99-290(+)